MFEDWYVFSKPYNKRRSSVSDGGSATAEGNWGLPIVDFSVVDRLLNSTRRKCEENYTEIMTQSGKLSVKGREVGSVMSAMIFCRWESCTSSEEQNEKCDGNVTTLNSEDCLDFQGSVLEEMDQLTSPTLPVMTGRHIADTSFLMMRVFTGLDPENSTCCFDLKWTSVSSRDGVFSNISLVRGSPWNALKNVTRVKASAETILKLLLDDNRVCEYDALVSAIDVLLKVDEKTCIRRISSKPVWLTAARDFLVCTTWKEIENNQGCMICSRYAPDELYEKQKNYVRGTMHVSGYWICPCSSLSKDDSMYEPAGSSSSPSCKVTLIVHSDLGGYLPAALMNLLSTEAPQKMMTLIRTLAEKEEKLPSPQQQLPQKTKVEDM